VGQLFKLLISTDIAMQRCTLGNIFDNHFFLKSLLIAVLLERPEDDVVAGKGLPYLQRCLVDILVAIIQQYLSHYALIAVIGDNVHNHPLPVPFENIHSLLQKSLHKILFGKAFVHTVILYKMAAPLIVPPE
jgi:hypothetical protein